MSVLIKGMKMPESCDLCCFAYWSNLHQTANCGRNDEPCFANYSTEYRTKRPNWCPLVEVPPNGDLIDKEVLYNKTAKLEAKARIQLDKLTKIPFGEMTQGEYIAWRVWRAVYQERLAFKHDVFDAPVVIEAEGDAERKRRKERAMELIPPDRKDGEWSEINIADYKALCSVCKTWSPIMGNYCPNCGARMKGEE